MSGKEETIKSQITKYCGHAGYHAKKIKRSLILLGGTQRACLMVSVVVPKGLGFYDAISIFTS